MQHSSRDKKREDRLSKKERKPPQESPLEAAAEAGHGKGFLMHLREWLDALIIAFVLAMFIRTFVVELFKIPSGSMSPTLLGDLVAEGSAFDSDSRGHFYLLIQDRRSRLVQVFRKTDGHYTYEGRRSPEQLTISQGDLLKSKRHVEEHRIFVNKFAYWFAKPDRGDIVVFRVPFPPAKQSSGWASRTFSGMDPNRFRPDEVVESYERDNHHFEVRSYNRNQGVYVKRAVAFDGELVSIGADGQLSIDGKPVADPPVFQVLRYLIRPEGTPEFSVRVKPDEMFVFGDNTDNSLDSRYWDGVPYVNLRGKAFFRYWPPRKMRFLN